MTRRLDIVGGVRALLAAGKVPPSPELDTLLGALDRALDDAERARLERALREALPELRALGARSAELAAEPGPAETPPALDPADARARLDALAAAWASQDGPRVDQLLRELEALLPGSAERERRRIEADVRASIASSFAGFKLPPLGGGER